MKGLENQTYVLLLVIANVFAALQLVAAIKWPRIARVSFFLLFAWACWMNWNTVLHTPKVYLEYAELSWLDGYTHFINGWFAHNIVSVVGTIACCQGLIALSMLLKGTVFTIGGAGGILFLIAILPFGVGSGFPATAIMALALYILLREHGKYFIWRRYWSGGGYP